MVRLNEDTGKVTGSPQKIPLSSKDECKAGLLRGMYTAHNNGLNNITFFYFYLTQH